MPCDVFDISRDPENPVYLATLYEDLSVEGDNTDWIRKEIEEKRDDYGDDIDMVWRYILRTFNNGYIMLRKTKYIPP